MELTTELFEKIFGVAQAEPAAADPNERRKHVRLAFGSRAVILPLFEIEGDGTPVLVRNASRGGVGLLAPSKMDAGDEFRIRFQTLQNEPIEIHCIVRGCAAGGSGGTLFAVGASFELVVAAPESLQALVAACGAAAGESAGEEAAPPKWEPGGDSTVEAESFSIPRSRSSGLGRLWSSTVGIFAENSSARLRRRLQAEKAGESAAEAPAPETNNNAPSPTPTILTPLIAAPQPDGTTRKSNLFVSKSLAPATIPMPAPATPAIPAAAPAAAEIPAVIEKPIVAEIAVPVEIPATVEISAVVEIAAPVEIPAIAEIPPAVEIPAAPVAPVIPAAEVQPVAQTPAPIAMPEFVVGEIVGMGGPIFFAPPINEIVSHFGIAPQAQPAAAAEQEEVEPEAASAPAPALPAAHPLTQSVNPFQYAVLCTAVKRGKKAPARRESAAERRHPRRNQNERRGLNSR